MKALVTGGSGFIGSHVVDRLIMKGFDVTCIVRPSSDLKWIDKNKVKIVKITFDDIEKLNDSVSEVEYVFHIAGLNFAKKESDYFKVNTLGTKQLIEVVSNICSRLKRFVYVSSLTASGPSNDFDDPVNELSPRNPVTAYGRSKRDAEDIVYSYGDKVPFTIIKPPAVIGPRDTAIFSLFKMMKYGFATHIGLTKKYISVIYAEDLARGIVESALSPKTINESYMLADPNFYDWDFISKIFKEKMDKQFYLKVKVPDPIVLLVGRITQLITILTKQESKFNYDKSIDFTRKYWTCSVEKAKDHFEFSTQYTFEDAIRKTYLWYKQNNWL